MRRHKFLVFLGSVLLLLCAFAFTGASFHQAFAASANVGVTHNTVNPDAACPATVGFGNAGQAVKFAQEGLNTQYTASTFTNSPYNFHPYSEASTPLKVDGNFGTDTENATKDFQHAHGLSVDGVVGPKTWHALGWC